MAPCVTFRISHRPGVEYERVRQISIIYDKETGRLVARLVVEVKLRGHGRVTGASRAQPVSCGRILWPYLGEPKRKLLRAS